MNKFVSALEKIAEPTQAQLVSDSTAAANSQLPTQKATEVARKNMRTASNKSYGYGNTPKDDSPQARLNTVAASDKWMLARDKAKADSTLAVNKDPNRDLKMMFDYKPKYKPIVNPAGLKSGDYSDNRFVKGETADKMDEAMKAKPDPKNVEKMKKAVEDTKAANK